MPNDDLIARLTELEAKATPGPWEADTSSPYDCVIWASAEDNNAFLANVGSDRMVPVLPGGPATIFDIDVKNAQLVVELRNAAPALIAVVRAAREQAKTCCDCPKCLALRSALKNLEKRS